MVITGKTEKSIANEACPLCAGEQVSAFYTKDLRPFWCCADCDLVFVPSAYHLSARDEKAEYDLHENDPADPGYRRFLSKLFNPVYERVVPVSQGLDFGCGPGPALAQMFEENGCTMRLYDPFYFCDETVWNRSYEFVVMSEVAEHLRKPGDVFCNLWQYLAKGGVLGVMTQLLTDPERFAKWRYKADPTHICFYTEATFRWLADQLGASCEIISGSVIILIKS